MTNYIGLDIGGTKIFAGKFSEDYKLINSVQNPTKSNLGKEILIKNIIEIIGKLIDKNTKKIGISWAGFVDTDHQTIKISPNIKKFEEINLGKIISQWFCLPINIENDSRCFAIAEQKTTYPNCRNLLGITFGTGVGGGIITNKTPLLGVQNYAGEIGHHLFAGKEIEKILSGTSLRKKFRKDLNQVIKMPKSKIKNQINSEIDILTQWLFNLSLTLNPEIIVFGGWVGQNFWSIFQNNIQKKLNSLYKKHSLPIQTKIKISKLKNSSCLGAILK